MGTVKNIQNSYINITCAFKYQSEEICKKSRKIRIHGQTDPDLQSGLLSEGTTYLFKCLQILDHSYLSYRTCKMTSISKYLEDQVTRVSVQFKWVRIILDIIEIDKEEEEDEVILEP